MVQVGQVPGIVLPNQLVGTDHDGLQHTNIVNLLSALLSTIKFMQYTQQDDSLWFTESLSDALLLRPEQFNLWVPQYATGGLYRLSLTLAECLSEATSYVKLFKTYNPQYEACTMDWTSNKSFVLVLALSRPPIIPSSLSTFPSTTFPQVAALFQSVPPSTLQLTTVSQSVSLTADTLQPAPAPSASSADSASRLASVLNLLSSWSAIKQSFRGVGLNPVSNSRALLAINIMSPCESLALSGKMMDGRKPIVDGGLMLQSMMVMESILLLLCFSADAAYLGYLEYIMSLNGDGYINVNSI
ncbi:hypothetical protein C8J56DRAFT_1046688 [Mycena floridula]|nr:hypothetical protein C8J56DRAFT_1046688 [Mycena floridula]